MRGAWRRVLLSVLLLTSLAALAYRYRRNIHLADFTWSKFVHVVSQANGWLLLLSLIAIYGCFALRALRWQRFCRYLGPSKFADVYGGTLMSFASIFLLGRAGELVRPLLLARKTGLQVSSMFGTYILDRLFDTAAAVVFAGLSLLLLPSLLSGGGARWEGEIRTVGGLLLLGVAGGIAFLAYFRLHGAGVMERRMASWSGRSGWRGRMVTQFKGFGEGLQAIRSFSDLAAVVGYSVVHWVLVALIYLWVAHSFGGPLGEISFRAAMLVLAFTLVGSTLQLPGVGGGAQVASFIAFTQIFRIDQESAAAAAFLIWLVTFGGVCLVGVPLLVHEGLSMGDLRRLVRSEAHAEETGGHMVNAASRGARLPDRQGDST
jgi:uncharacterized protein (TIRG00374 family)